MGLLDRIVAVKAKEHAAFLTQHADAEAYRRGVEAKLPPAGRFVGALRTGRLPQNDLAVIAECKKASPSLGVIRSDYDAAEIADTYKSLGAAAISVLTDHEFFQGSLADAERVARLGIPVLRKDFVLYDEQIYEAAAIGASAVLLILRLLDDQNLHKLLATARRLHLDVLVETHNEDEVRRALDADCGIIGINHRDLDTLRIDLSLTEQCASMIRDRNPGTVIVAESGVEDRAFLARLRGVADAVLVGSYFMRASDVRAAWQALFA